MTLNLGLTEAQKEARKLGIGGSDVRRMLDDPVGLWEEKLGMREPEDLSGVLAVQMGNATEDFNAYWFGKVTGRLVGRRGEHRVHSQHKFMRANLDGVTTTAHGALAYWDAKHVGRSDEAMVIRYTPQMVHNATVIGADFWILSVFVGNSKHEIIEQEVDVFFAEELIAKEREFWRCVTERVRPADPVGDVVAPKPAPRYRTVNLDKDAMPNWGADMLEHISLFSSTEGAAKAHAIARKEIGALLPEDVGTLLRGKFSAKRSKTGVITMKTEA